MQTLFWRLGVVGILLGLLALSSGCASVKSPDERDPLESFNRSMYQFNDAFDRSIARPVAETYHEYMPGFVQNGVTNFFSNLDDVLVVANDVLQLKLVQAVQDFARLIVNSVVGLLGFFDVDTHFGLPKHHEDFGQTLATWGVGNGPYIVLPFLGPSTLRDTVGIGADWQIDPVMQVDDTASRWGLIALRGLDKRVSLLEATKAMERSGIDPYVFMRDAYYQYRLNQIYDGNPPREQMPTTTKEDRKLEEDLEKELQGGKTSP